MTPWAPDGAKNLGVTRQLRLETRHRRRAKIIIAKLIDTKQGDYLYLTTL